MEFHVVAVGRMRDPGLRQAHDEYLARAGRYFPCRLHETAGARKAKDAAGITQEEAVGLLRAIPRRATAVALTRAGRALGSREFATALDRWQLAALDVAFVVGGAFGLHGSVLERCGETLSLSRMTLPHELARVLLLEQLYRGGSILRGEPYHKGD